LALAGIIMALKSKKQLFKHAGVLLFYGGCASIVYGFLFGSIFGVEHLLPTLWIKPIDSISELFKLAIYFGIGMITLAMVINIINGIRKRNFLGLIFDKAGLLAAILYWSGIVVVTRMLTTQAEAKGEVPVFVIILMLSAVLLLFFREPILHLAEGKKKLFPEGVTTGIMGGMVEILEIFLGFLANTVSFIRVAAFGLAHAGLFMAICALSDAVQGMAGGLISGLVIFFGNVLIIGLEGLVVTIQAVRLEFYEFFSRFFEQTDSKYQPIGAELKNT
jgi:V/A-type H+-transporting ATPase subunit I